MARWLAARNITGAYSGIGRAVAIALFP